MSRPNLNLSAQDYWPRAFVRAVEQLAEFRENPGIWARFLGRGVRYRLSDRGQMIRRLLEDVAKAGARLRWNRVWQNDLAARQALEDLEREVDTRPDPAALPRLTRGRPAGDSDATILSLPPGVPGHLRVMVELPHRGFSVEDLVVGTTTRTVRGLEREAGLEEYASSVPIVDRALEHIEAEWRLPGDAPPPVIDFLCLAGSSNPIGTAERPEDGRSLDLGLLLCAASHRYGWRLRTDRVVVTGTLDLDSPMAQLGRVVAVSYIREKLEAVTVWLERLPPSPEGRPRCEVILPRLNALDVGDNLARIEELGGQVHLVSSVEEAIAALPFVERTMPVQQLRFLDGVVVGMGFLLWAERLFLGEFLADPQTREMHDGWSYALVSVAPAIIPTLAMRLLLRAGRGSSAPKALFRASILTLIMIGAGHGMFLLQLFIGGVDFPPESYSLWRSTRDIRVGCVYKDVAIFYPLMVGALGVTPLRRSADALLARISRQAGGVLGEQWQIHRRAALDVPGWHQILHRGMFIAGGIMLLLLARDFVEGWGRRNWALVAHLAYQIAWPVLMGFVVSEELARRR